MVDQYSGKRVARLKQDHRYYQLKVLSRYRQIHQAISTGLAVAFPKSAIKPNAHADHSCKLLTAAQLRCISWTSPVRTGSLSISRKT
jgi:hypothetical protein